jgi:LacI family transcriptional regulator
MAPSRQGANLSAIAATLGVSVATVSNALSGKGRVSAELVERIRKTADELGYIPSSAGRALRTGRTGVLGLVLPDITNPLFPEIAQGIENAAAASGYGLLIADSHGDISMQTEAINRLIERGVDGMVIIPRRGSRIGAVDCPVAVIDAPSTPGNTVSADHWEGGAELGRYLAGLGHRKIVLVGKSSDSNVQNDRLSGVRSGLPKGSSAEALWIDRVEELHGKDCELGLCERVASGVTAFAAASDLHALRVMAELQRGGILVPDHASVTGFDNLLWAPLVTPSLTTMRMDIPRISRLAIDALLRVIDGDDGADIPGSGGIAAEVSKVPMELIVRQSTGPARPIEIYHNNPVGERHPC